MPNGGLRTELIGDHGILAVETPRLAARPTGTGDVFAAALLHHILCERSLSRSLELAVETVFGAVEHAIADGSKEMDPSRMGVPNPESSRRFPATHRTV